MYNNFTSRISITGNLFLIYKQNLQNITVLVSEIDITGYLYILPLLQHIMDLRFLWLPSKDVEYWLMITHINRYFSGTDKYLRRRYTSKSHFQKHLCKKIQYRSAASDLIFNSALEIWLTRSYS